MWYPPLTKKVGLQARIIYAKCCTIWNYLLAMKVSTFTVAKRYVDALFEVSKAQAIVEIIEKDFAVLQEVLDKNTNFLNFVVPAVVPSKIKQVFLNTLLAEIKLHPVTINTLNLLIRHNRIAALNLIMQQFALKASEARGEVQAFVEVAEALSEEQQKKIIGRLEEVFHKKVILNINIKQSVLGGLMVRVKDHMLDNTVRSKLENIKRIALR